MIADGTRDRASGRWTPAFGAWPEAGGVRFRVWAPGQSAVSVLLDPDGRAERRPLTAGGDGCFSAHVDGLGAGARYKYVIDGERSFPDPASRAQPDGVHGASAVVDPARFAWTDGGWAGVALEDLVLYELHVGTFSPAGTFAGAADRLTELVDLGVTAIELMPVADFPGQRNWGYDGACLYAPARAYGTPDDLRRLVDRAHAAGLGVLLDVVYNHFGPDGAYATVFSPAFLSARHQSPWGAAANVDGPGSEGARAFFIDNALHWLHEYHLDGLRLDATHAIVDESPRHVLAELAARVRSQGPARHVLLTAEDDRNLAAIVRPEAEGGWGFDAVWSDDVHHGFRRMIAGDKDAYFGDYAGTAEELTATLRNGWLYRGEVSAYRGAPRGTDPAGVPLQRMIAFLQNHDQVGNRAFGERLHHQIDHAVYRAATALWLLAPETPMLFMGQEWAASTPFLYFTDHEPELGRRVTEGRRAEFGRFDAFRDEARRARIPDPQAPDTFEASRLRWTEREDASHAGMLQLHRELIALRRSEPALRPAPGARVDIAALDEGVIGLLRTAPTGESLLLVARLSGTGTVDMGRWPAVSGGSPWTRVLTTEDERFAGGRAGPVMDEAGAIAFPGPAAVLLRRG